MQSKVKIEDFSNAIAAQLGDERVRIFKKIQDGIEHIAKTTRTIIQIEADAQGLPSKYVNSIKYKNDLKKSKYSGNTTYIVFSTKPQLVHLIENGHATVLEHGKYGKRRSTRAFPHFSEGAEHADWMMEQLIKEIADETK